VSTNKRASINEIEHWFMRKLLKYIAFLIPWLVVYVIIVEAYNK